MVYIGIGGERQVERQVELSFPAIKKKKQIPHRRELRVKPNSDFTCHTAREQLVFILNEAPVGVFQEASSKNNPVTLHSDWQPSGGHRDGVIGG